MRIVQWIAAIVLSIMLIAAVHDKAPVTTLFLLCCATFALWLVVAKQADLDDAVDEAKRRGKIMCGTCHQTFDTWVEYNNHVYELGGDDRDQAPHHD